MAMPTYLVERYLPGHVDSSLLSLATTKLRVSAVKRLARGGLRPPLASGITACV